MEEKKVETGGKKFEEDKWGRKVRVPKDCLITNQLQTAEPIRTPGLAEKSRIFLPNRQAYGKAFGVI